MNHTMDKLAADAEASTLTDAAKANRHFAAAAAVVSGLAWGLLARNAYVFLLTVALCLSHSLYSDMRRDSKLKRAGYSVFVGAWVYLVTCLMEHGGLLRAVR
ncbi:MAG: hypothetical protein HZC42_14350 [Candidatus Eisenbacteria bacterium]|nr:hypothetical protein [Candidatus Eisenbacteria bacterium]